MHSPLRFTIIIAIIGLIIAGCSGHNSSPVAPNETPSPQNLTANADISADSVVNSHYLLSSGLIFINTENPDDPKFEIVPVREGEIHLNILKFLEGAPCYDCFRIVGFNFPGPGYENLNLDIRIDHPFNQLLYSIFDVRGIIIFDGSHLFPFIGKTTSDPSIGEGSLLNADGYTALYNGSTLAAPVGDYQKYFPGKLSTVTMPNSDINGYIYFKTDGPLNDRNAFYANSFDVKTFSMKLPTDVFVIGYAVDASWAPPIGTPVDDPLADFDTTANCTEPWKIEVQDLGPGLTWESGTTKLQIDVYDWQGKSTHHAPVVECPEIFNGIYSAIWVSDGDGFTRYEADISYTNLASGGEYECLVGVEANENDPVGKPWLDLTAYEVFNISVVEDNPFNLVDVTPPWLNFEPHDISFDGNYAYIAGGMHGLLIFDINDPLNPVFVSKIDTPWKAKHVLASGGYVYVSDFEARLHIFDCDPIESTCIISSLSFPNGVEGFTISGNYVYLTDGDSGLQIIDISQPESPNIICSLPVNGYTYDVAVEGNYAYVVGGHDGFVIVDIENPESAFIFDTMLGGSASIAVSGGYAYVCGNSGVQIIDLDPLESAHTVTVVHLDDQGAEDIVLSNGFAFVTGPWGFHVIDIEPQETAHVVSSVEHLHWGCAVAMSGSYVYVVEERYGIQIMCVSPQSSAYLAKYLETPCIAVDVAVSDGYAFVADSYAGLEIVDIAQPESAYIYNTVQILGGSDEMAMSGAYSYFMDHSDNFYIVDINPVESAHFVNWIKLPLEEWDDDIFDIAVSGDYAYAAADGTGLHIIDIDPPESVSVVTTIPTAGHAIGVDVSGDYAYVAEGNKGIQIIDVNPPESFEIVKTIDPGFSSKVTISGSYAYVTDSSHGNLYIIDIDPPESAYIVNSVETPHTYGDVIQVVVLDGYAYIADGKAGLQIVDVDPPESAHIVSSLDTPSYAINVAVSDGYAYVADYEGGLRIIKLW
jgi:hypothetical protein